MLLNVEVDHDKVIQDINTSKATVESAVMKALNKTALWLKVQASSEISKEKQIKLSAIRKRLRIIKASKSSMNTLVKASFYGIKAGKLGTMKQTPRCIYSNDEKWTYGNFSKEVWIIFTN